MILVTPAWPSQLWYPEAMRMSIQQPILSTWRRDFLKNSKGDFDPLFENKTLKLVNMDGLRARSQEEGVSQEASNLIIKLKRWSSNPKYESAWCKWASWCVERKIDPFYSNINPIPEFLYHLFQNGPQYRTINNCRSARFSFHDHIQG